MMNADEVRTYVAEENDFIKVVATEWVKGGEIVRRDVEVIVKKFPNQEVKDGEFCRNL